MIWLCLDINVLYYENDEGIYFENAQNEKKRNDIEWSVVFVI